MFADKLVVYSYYQNFTLSFSKSIPQSILETHLTNKNINPRFIDYLQGHSSKDTGANIYMKGIKPEVLLKECVEKFDWGIDWEKLKVKF